MHTPLFKRIDAEELFTAGEQCPVGFKLVVMDLHPSVRQLHLSTGNAAFQYSAIQRDDQFIAGVFYVNVRHLVFPAVFLIHSNDDSIKAAQYRHAGHSFRHYYNRCKGKRQSVPASFLISEIKKLFRGDLKDLAQLENDIEGDANVAELDRADVTPVDVDELGKLQLRELFALTVNYNNNSVPLQIDLHVLLRRVFELRGDLL